MNWFKIPFVQFKYRNAEDGIEIVRTHIKETNEDSIWVHGFNKSYLRSRIVGPVELVVYCGYDNEGSGSV